MSALGFRWSALALLIVCLLLVLGMSNRGLASSPLQSVRLINIPGEDRFTPFAMTIRAGQTVEWINNDTDDHTVVSNDAFNTAGHRGVNVLLHSGDTFNLTFKHPGVFPFYCRLHSMLDADNQPKAPGPDGGIQDPDGNFGTPMNGVITVLGDD